MGQSEFSKCEVQYSTLEIDGFPKPLIYEEYFVDGRPARPHDLPTGVGRDPDTGAVVFQAWQDETGKYHREKTAGEWKPAVIIDGDEPMCEWYHRGKVIKMSHPSDAYIDPITGLQKYIYKAEPSLMPNWERSLEIP